MLNPLAKEGWKLKLQKGLRILADFLSNGVSNCGTYQEWVPNFERNKTLAMPLALLSEHGTHQRFPLKKEISNYHSWRKPL